jgi:hypothetical protein
VARAPLFGWPLYSDASVTYTPTFSGGSWSASWPLTNLADRRLEKYARSADATTTNTQFETDLKVARAVSVLALPKNNFSTAATMRWRASSSAGSFGSPIYDSGWVAAWPAGVSVETANGLNVAAVHIPTSAQTARYWLCEIDDTANTNGYVEIGRVVIAGAWRPATGLSFGGKLGLETATKRTQTDGGVALYESYAVRRTWAFGVEHMAKAEGIGSAWKLKRLLGATGQLFFVFDTADTLMYERAFLCTMRELDGLSYPYGTWTATTFLLAEAL